MRTPLTFAAAFLIAVAGATSAEAAAKQCRDAKGKFIKCETAAAPAKCRDIKTKKFAKCGTPGTRGSMSLAILKTFVGAGAP